VAGKAQDPARLGWSDGTLALRALQLALRPETPREPGCDAFARARAVDPEEDVLSVAREGRPAACPFLIQVVSPHVRPQRREGGPVWHPCRRRLETLADPPPRPPILADHP
jgi:hypothetical protein